MRKALVYILLLILLTGCSSLPPPEAAAYIASITPNPKYKESDDAYNMLAAVAYHDTGMVRKLLKKGVNPDIPLSSDGTTALMLASEDGHTDIVKLLLENKADVNAKNKNGRTALINAVAVRFMHKDNTDCIKLLMKAGANVNSQDQYGMTPLYFAVTNHDREIFEMLIKSDANVNAVSSCSGLDGTALHCLARPWKPPPRVKNDDWNDIEAATTLLHHGANPNIRVKDRWSNKDITPLSIAYKEDKKELLDLLLSYGADVNVSGDKELSLYHLAVKKNDKEMVKILIARHTDITVKPKQSYTTPFHYAVRYSSPEIVELMIAAYPDMVNAGGGKEGGMNLLEIAADSGRIEIVKLLFDHGADFSTEGKEGYNMPLHFAKTKEIAELLISKGCDVNGRRQSRYTPLLMAASHRNPEVAKCLIDHGADVNARNDDGQTPLHKAVKNWNKEIIDMLLAKGADINTKDYHGKTVAWIIKDNIKMKSYPQDLQEMTAFLEKLEKKTAD